MPWNPNREVLVVMVAVSFLFGAGCGTAGKTNKAEDGPLRHYQLARMHYEQGSIPRALAELKTSLAMDDSLPQTHFYLGFIHWRAGEWEQAEAPLRRAVELNPYFTDARMYLADCLDNEGQPDEAVAVLTKALEDKTYPHVEKIFFNRAMIYDRMGRLSESLADLRRAVEIRPRYYLAHSEMARLFDQLGRQDDALRAFASAEPGLREDPGFLYRYGAALFRAGRAAEASSRLRKVTEIAPGSKNAEDASKLLGVMG